MSNNKINIPEGWSYFAHRTNTSKWKGNPIENGMVYTKKLMSAITERDVIQEVKDYGKSKRKGYSAGNGTPFEIRCLLPSLQYIKTLEESSNVRSIVINEYYFDRNNFGGCGGQRHPSIPKREELKVLAIGNYDEVYDNESTIIWTIPKRLLEFYEAELKKNKNREINLISPLLEQYQKEFDSASEHIGGELFCNMEFMQSLHDLYEKNPAVFLEDSLNKTIDGIKDEYIRNKENEKIEKSNFKDSVNDDTDEIS